MIETIRKVSNLNGHDFLLSPIDLDFSNRTLVLTGEITDDLAAFFNSAIRCLARESDDDITIYILSGGGSVSAGFSIYDTLEAVDCDITTVACGLTASMAAFIATAGGTKGKRWVQPNAEILIHQPLGGISGKASDIEIHAEHILKIRKKLNQIISEKTGQPYEKVKKDTERDKIMDAKAALEYGLADKIGDPISEV